MTAKGEKTVFSEILKEVEERDYRDMHRETAPLKKAEDAVEVDTSYMNVQEVEDCIAGMIQELKK